MKELNRSHPHLKRHIYVAASHPRLKEAAALAEQLREDGHIVVSTWHDEGDAQGYAELTKEPLDERMVLASVMDLRQCRIADTLVCLTGDELTRGGRHSEFGIAAALGHELFLVGPREQVFHYLPDVCTCGSTEQLRRVICCI